jgi:hypothetical protein
MKRLDLKIIVEFISDVEIKKSNENDYETSVDEKEDNPIQELIIVPKTSTVESQRRILAMSLASGK